MALYTDILPNEDDEAGIHRQDFSNAVGIWVSMTGSRRSVADAAVAFNTTPELIRQAVADHYWLFAAWPHDEADPAKQFFEPDGE